jgi:hypothetical protein
MTTQSHVIGMQNEVSFAKVFEQVYQVPLQDLIYFVFDDTKSREVVKGAFGGDNAPSIVYSSEQQLNGSDFMYKGISLDLKVNGARWDNPFFELYSHDGEYSYNKPKDSHVIVAIMAGTSYIYSIPASLVECIVNHDIANLPIPANFYYEKSLFRVIDCKQDLQEKGKTGFVISKDVLQACIRPYLAFRCGNGMLSYLLMQTKPYHDTMSEYKEN